MIKEYGTYKLFLCNPTIYEFCLTELGVYENEFLANVSEIIGNAKFKDSKVIDLPKLEQVIGKFILEDTNLSDARTLKVFNGYKIILE